MFLSPDHDLTIPTELYGRAVLHVSGVGGVRVNSHLDLRRLAARRPSEACSAALSDDMSVWPEKPLARSVSVQSSLFLAVTLAMVEMVAAGGAVRGMVSQVPWAGGPEGPMADTSPGELKISCYIILCDTVLHLSCTCVHIHSQLR